MTEIIAFINQKGGVGKTTSAINIATVLGMLKKTVLLIDMDPQCNLTTGIGMRENSLKGDNIYEFIANRKEIADIIKKNVFENVDAILSSDNLSAFDTEVALMKEREFIIKNKMLDVGGGYDYLIVDCPPSLGQLTINIFAFANRIIIPMQCEFFSLQGIAHIIKTIDSIKSFLNPKITILGILLTMYDRRNNLSKDVMENVKKNLGGLLFENIIPRNIKLSEASSFGIPGVLYDMKSSGAIAYFMLTREILKRLND